MKKEIIIFYSILILCFSSYSSFNNSTQVPDESIYNNTNLLVIEGIQYVDTLIIEGNNIWIRNKPRIGEVVFTLDEGSLCYVLEKGEEQTIRGNKDFWYKIEYEGKIGWVFGSQTSIKQNPPEEFKDFLEKFISAFARSDTIRIQNFVSPVRGFDYTFLVCKMEGMGVYEHIAESHFETKHYNRGTDLIDVMMDFDSFIWLGGSNNNNIDLSWHELENGMIEIVTGFYDMDDLTLQFRRVEGKWHLHSIKESICYDALGA